MYMDPKLKFSDHITTMVNKARGELAFIKRWSKEFGDPYVTKTLFISLVRPFPIWSPQYGVHIDRIESVQKNFLIFALRRLNWDTSLILPSYSSTLLLLNLSSLANRRTMLGITFIRNLIHGDAESPELLGRLHFNVPNRFTRNYIPLVLNPCISNYAMHEPFRVPCNDYNGLYHLISTTDSLPIFKSIILSSLETN